MPVRGTTTEMRGNASTPPGWRRRRARALQIARRRHRRLLRMGQDALLAVSRHHLGTHLRGTRLYQLPRLGTFMERADNTARILGREVSRVASAGEEEATDQFYEWGALLRSVSALRSHCKVHVMSSRRTELAELLILLTGYAALGCIFIRTA